MTVTRSSPARSTHKPLVRRVLTRAGGTITSAVELVEWADRSVKIAAPDGTVAFACDDLEAPVAWSNLAVAVVARQYLAHVAGAAPERSVRALVERVIGPVAGWARTGGQAPTPRSTRRCSTSSPRWF